MNLDGIVDSAFAEFKNEQKSTKGKSNAGLIESAVGKTDPKSNDR